MAVPSEHGGWGLTLEPVLVGLLIAPSSAGVLLGATALMAFLLRTPLKLVVVDVRRGRWLDRSRLALRLAVVEGVVLVILCVGAIAAAGWSWAVPVAISAPLIAVELWFDFKSRGRRLIPELCGATAIAAVSAAIIVADDNGARLAAGTWLILTARVMASIPFVKSQIDRLHHRATQPRFTNVAQAAAVLTAAAAAFIDRELAAGAVAVVIVVALQTLSARRPPPTAKVLGVRQMILGIVVAGVTGAGVAVT